MYNSYIIIGNIHIRNFMEKNILKFIVRDIWGKKHEITYIHCVGFNENVPIGSYIWIPWSPIGRIVWEWLGDVALLD